MRPLITGFVGAVAEAWQEVRVHRGRVLLSLVGVAAAVAALTFSMAVADLAKQAVTDSMERSVGRPVTLLMSAEPKQQQQSAATDTTVRDAWFETMRRADIRYATRQLHADVKVRTSTGETPIFVTMVDQQFGMLRHIVPIKGQWFQPGDTERLAPPIVINRVLWERMGSPDLSSHPTLVAGAWSNTTFVVVGVTEASQWSSEEAFMLYPSVERVAAHDPKISWAYTSYSMWIPPDVATPLAAQVKQSMRSALGENFAVEVSRNDEMYGQSGMDSTEIFRLMSLGIGAIILVLGALGLVNIAIVSVRQRIREIGVRRSFGATQGRIFFAVMMESVVATVVAGVVGVMIAVIVMRIPVVYGAFSMMGEATAAPPFPVGAAVIGMVSATVVGALAGLIPAIIATRVKVIDAIRF